MLDTIKITIIISLCMGLFSCALQKQQNRTGHGANHFFEIEDAITTLQDLPNNKTEQPKHTATGKPDENTSIHICVEGYSSHFYSQTAKVQLKKKYHQGGKVIDYGIKLKTNPVLFSLKNKTGLPASNTADGPPPGRVLHPLALISFLSSLATFIPFIGLLALIAAIVTGILALIKINREPDYYWGRGFAIAGLIIAGLQLILAMAIIILFIILFM